jgi:hypothetical protein
VEPLLSIDIIEASLRFGFQIHPALVYDNVFSFFFSPLAAASASGWSTVYLNNSFGWRRVALKCC